MTDTEKINELKLILYNQIKWYKDKIDVEGEDYVYDEIYQQFNDLDQSDFVEIIKTIVSEDKTP